MPTATRSDASVSVRVLLSPETLAKYEEQAREQGIDLERVLADRLFDCANHTSTKPYYFNDEQRQELEHLLGKNMQRPSDVLTQLRKCVSIKLENVKISLKPGLLSRLKTRCLGMRWEDFLEMIVVEDLERYVGMR